MEALHGAAANAYTLTSRILWEEPWTELCLHQQIPVSPSGELLPILRIIVLTAHHWKSQITGFAGSAQDLSLLQMSARDVRKLAIQPWRRWPAPVYSLALFIRIAWEHCSKFGHILRRVTCIRYVYRGDARTPTSATAFLIFTLCQQCTWICAEPWSNPKDLNYLEI